MKQKQFNFFWIRKWLAVGCFVYLKKYNIILYSPPCSKRIEDELKEINIEIETLKMKLKTKNEYPLTKNKIGL